MKILTIMSNPENVMLVSVVSIWEIAMKLNRNIGVIDYDIESLYDTIQCGNSKILPLEKEHFMVYQFLEQKHKDPFDRLLISTAKAENIPLLTSDKNIQKYDVEWIW